MAFLFAVLAFTIPIVNRKFFIYAQGLAAVIWILLMASIDAAQEPTPYGDMLRLIQSYTLPTWVFGSLIAHYLIVKEKYSQKEGK